MELTTVKEYCAARSVSRQFVYDYVKRGKFEMLELPIFVNLEGSIIEVGKKKFLKVPPQYSAIKKEYWSGDVSDHDYARAMAADATTDIEIREHLTRYLNLPSKDMKMKYKAQLHELYSISNPKRAILDAAFKKCIALMMAEMSNIEQSVSQLEEQN